MQLRRRLIMLAGIIMLLAINQAIAQQGTPQVSAGPIQLSARQAVELALTNQSTIKTAKLDELIQLAKNKEVSGQALPNLSANGQYQDNPIIQKQLIDASNFDPSVPKGTLVPFAFGLKFNVVGEVKLQQVLFDPSVLVALQARKTLEELANRNVKKSEMDVKVAVYKAYYNVLSTRKALKIMQDNLVTMDKNLRETSEMYNAGTVEKLDVDRLQIQITNLRTEESRLLNTEEVGLATLKFQIGISMLQDIVLTDSLTTEEIASVPQTDADQFDYTQRIEFQALQSQKKAYEYDLKRYKLKGIPSLSLFSTAGISRASNTFNYFKQETWYGYVNYGVSLSIPIFSGLQRRRQVDQAFLTVKKSEVSMENLKLSIDMERQQSNSTFRYNVKTLEAQERNMKLAKDVYDVSVIKYKEGVGSSLEVNTAEKDLLTAQSNYFTAMYNAIVAKIDYLKANGKL